LAIVFKKQEISQQAVTRMQHLASEFSKIFRGWYPRTLTAGGATLSRTQHPAVYHCGWVVKARMIPVLGPKPWSPLTFQPWLRPWSVTYRCWECIPIPVDLLL